MAQMVIMASRSTMRRCLCARTTEAMSMLPSASLCTSTKSDLITWWASNSRMVSPTDRASGTGIRVMRVSAVGVIPCDRDPWGRKRSG